MNQKLRLSHLKIMTSLLCNSLFIVLAFLALRTICACANTVQRDEFISYVSSNSAGYTPIHNAEELINISKNLSGKYVLVEDIDLSGYTNFSPIGTTHTAAFTGVLEGDGHIIRGLNVQQSFYSGTIAAPSYTAGLFGVCDGAVIRNLGLEDVNISIITTSGYRYVSNLDSEYSVFAGAIAGYAEKNTIIYNCYATGNIQAKAYEEGYSAAIAGGLIGYGNNTDIRFSRNSCSVTAYNGNATQAYDSFAGGIIGRSGGDCSIDVSMNSGTVNARTLDYGKAYAGGLLGYSVSTTADIENAYNSAEVQSLSGNNFCDPAYAGGIAGKYAGHISKCYNNGSVKAQAADPYGINNSLAYVGGICGEASAEAVITNCASVAPQVSANASGTTSQYRVSNGGTKNNNVTNSTMVTNSSNDANTSGTDSEFQNEAIWKDTLGWELSDIWIVDHDYPKFQKIFPEEDEWSGSLDWFITDDGTLVISGKGDMPQWNDSESVPWHLEASNVRRIQISDSITSIGSFAFYWFSRCETVEIGKSVRSIGMDAFAGCISITEIVIPENIERIDHGAFLGCNAKKYTFEGKAPGIENSAFTGGQADVYYYSNRGDWEGVADKNYGGSLSWTDLYLAENGMIDSSSVSYRQENKDGTFLKDVSLPATPSSNVSQYAAELYNWACQLGYGDVLTKDVCSKIVSRYMPTVVSAEGGGVFTEDEYKTWEIMRDVLMINSMKRSLNQWQDEYLTGTVDLKAARERLTQILGVYTNYTQTVNRSPIMTAVYNVYSLKVVQTALNSIWSIAKENAYGYEKELLENSIKNYDLSELLSYLSEAKVTLKEDGLDAIASSIGWTAQETWEDIAANGGKSIVKAITKDVKGTLINTLYELHPAVKEIHDFYSIAQSYVSSFKKYSYISLYAPQLNFYILLLQMGKEILETAGDVKTAQYFMIQYYLLQVCPDLYDVVIDSEGNIVDWMTWNEYVSTHSDLDHNFLQLMDNWYQKGNDTLVDTDKRRTVAIQASTASTLQNMSPEAMKKEIVEYWKDRISGVSAVSETSQVQFKLETDSEVYVVDKDGKEIASYSTQNGYQPLNTETKKLKIGVRKSRDYSGNQNENILFVVDENSMFVTVSCLSEDYGIRIKKDVTGVGVDVKTTDELEYASIYDYLPAGTSLYVIDGRIVARTEDGEEVDAKLKYTQEQDKVRKDLEMLEIGFKDGEDESFVKTDLTLPESGEYGSKITWTSSNAESITADGKVQRSDDDLQISLTATAVLGDYSETKQFDVVVKGTNTSISAYSIADGELLGEIVVKEGTTISEEELESLLPAGAEFGGWYYDKEKSLSYHPWEVIMQDTILYADYAVDNSLHFTKQPEGNTYAVGEAPLSISVDYFPEEGTTIQWYAAEKENSENRVLIEGEGGKAILPDITAPGVTFYFAVIQNGEAVVTSNYARIEVKDPAIIGEGKCGDSAKWTLDNEGRLIINGSGKMEEYSQEQPAPWKEYADQINTVIVQEPITRIGKNAFSGMTGLKSAVVMDSVESISEGAFSGCTSLETLQLPFAGVSRNASGEDAVFGTIFGTVSDNGIVQYHALNGTQLSGYRYGIPETLRNVSITNAETIGFGAFYNCSFLQNITLNDGLNTIGQYAFANCNGLKEFVVPSSTSQISEAAFSGCEMLECITVPFIGTSVTNNNNSESVFGSIFGKASNRTVQYYSLEGTSLSGASYAIPAPLKKVYVTNEQRIPIGAFCNCSSIEEIHLSADISSIGLYAFYQCNSLRDIYYDSTSEKWEAIPKDLRGNDVLNTVTIHYKENQPTMYTVSFETGTEKEIADVQLAEGALLAEPETPVKEGYLFTGWYTSIESMEPYDFSQPVNSDLKLYACWESANMEGRIVFGAAIKEIREEAFYDCENIKEICFTGDMPVIGINAFKNIRADAVIYVPLNNATWSIEKLREAGVENEVLMWDPVSGKRVAH